MSASVVTLQMWERLADNWRESRRVSRPFLRAQFPAQTDEEYDAIHDRSVLGRCLDLDRLDKKPE